MYKGLKRVCERGLEPGLPRALKVTNGEDIFVFEVMKQRLLKQCLFFGDTGNNKREDMQIFVENIEDDIFISYFLSFFVVYFHI